MASILVFFTVSATAITPTSRPFAEKYIGVLPTIAKSLPSFKASFKFPFIPLSSINLKFPARHFEFCIIASIPLPGICLNSSISNKIPLFAFPNSTIPCPMGCSDFPSMEYAREMNLSLLILSRIPISVTLGFPSVIVPVLSKTTVFTL